LVVSGNAVLRTSAGFGSGGLGRPAVRSGRHRGR
jgi:hypothetical protein